eukprot:229380-Prymnesium_polylepis.7
MLSHQDWSEATPLHPADFEPPCTQRIIESGCQLRCGNTAALREKVNAHQAIPEERVHCPHLHLVCVHDPRVAHV